MQAISGIDICCGVRYCEHMETETFGQRLRRIRESRGVGLRELHRRTGIGLSTLQQWESGKRWAGKAPPGDDIQRIELALGIPAGSLLFPENTSPPQLTDAELLRRMGAEPLPPDDALFIEEFTGSARHGVSNRIPQDFDDTMPKRRRNRRYEGLFILRVEGACMEPEIHQGDVLIFDTRRQAEPGNIVVAVLNEEETHIKRLVERDGYRFLESLDGWSHVVDWRVRIVGVAVGGQYRLL